MQNIFKGLQNITKFNTQNFNYCAKFTFTQQNWPRPWKSFQNVEKKDLEDLHKMKNVLRKNMPKVHQKAKYGLYHGRVNKTGLQTCFSEKKTKRWWKVNVFKKEFESKVLQRKIQMPVSSTALKNIRKYGGFDNYILLCKSQLMYSPYGEYLRKLMITKMNDPEWRVPYIVKSKEIKKKFTKRQLRFKGKEPFWYPPDQRYIDLSHLRLKQMHELNRQELKNLKELEELENKQEDISANHPLIKEIQDQIQREMDILEPDRQKAIEKLHSVKDKKYLESILKYVQEGQKEFANPPNIKN